MALPPNVVPVKGCQDIEKYTNLDTEFAWYGPYYHSVEIYYEIRYIMSKYGPYKAKAYSTDDILEILPPKLHNDEYDFDYDFVIRRTRTGWLATYENPVWIAHNEEMLRDRGLSDKEIDLLEQWRTYIPHHFGSPTIREAIASLFVAMVRGGKLDEYKRED